MIETIVRKAQTIDVHSDATQKNAKNNLKQFVIANILEVNAKNIERMLKRYRESALCRFEPKELSGIHYIRFNGETYGYSNIYLITPTDVRGIISIKNLETFAAIFNARTPEDRKALGRMVTRETIALLAANKAVDLELRKVKNGWYLTDERNVAKDYKKFRTDSDVLTHVFIPNGYAPYGNEELEILTLQANTPRGTTSCGKVTVWVEQCPTRKNYLQFTIKAGGIPHRLYISKKTGNVLSYHAIMEAAKLRDKLNEAAKAEQSDSFSFVPEKPKARKHVKR